jgi:hypothetical protein
LLHVLVALYYLGLVREGCKWFIDVSFIITELLPPSHY